MEAPYASPACRICGNARGNARFRAREMQFGTREEFDYFRCASCGCLQISEVPEDLARHYPAAYYSGRPLDERKYAGLAGRLRVLPCEASLRPDTPLRRAIARIFPRRHFSCLSGLGIDRGARVLDVGCGNGKSFLYPLRRIGFERAEGRDPFLRAAIRYENGPSITTRRLEVTEGDGAWDLVTFHHSLEHVADPLRALREARRLLRSGGHCLVRVPLCSSYAWERYGVHWVQLDAPRHLFLHSVESMRLLADGAGLRTVRIAHDSHSIQFWGSEAYVRDVPLSAGRRATGRGGIAWPLRKWRLDRCAAALDRAGRGDQAAFLMVREPAGEGAGR